MSEPRAQIPIILAYHRVAEPDIDPWELAVAPDRFEAQLAVLRETREPFAMSAFLERLERGTLPANAVAVTGDGGFLMNSQELETAVRLELPLVILVWRDDGYGVIRWKQMTRYGRTSSVDFGNPDLVGYAKSFGAAGYRVTDASELRPLLAKALTSRVPVIIDCPVDYTENLRLTERLKSLPH